MTRSELKPLTSVRGIFAWMVVLYHIRLACLGWLPIGAVHVLAKGYLAVDFFFLLSGFVIWLNYGQRLRTARRDPPTSSSAGSRGSGRCMSVMLGMRCGDRDACCSPPAGRADHFPFAVLPLHLAMMQDWGWSDALLWNDPAWSISGEWACVSAHPAGRC